MNNPIGLSEVEIERLISRLIKTRDRTAEGTVTRLVNVCISALETWRQGRIDITDLPYFESNLQQSFNAAARTEKEQEPETVQSLFWLFFYLFAAQSERSFARNFFGDLDLEFDQIADELEEVLPGDLRRRIRFLRWELPKSLFQSLVKAERAHAMSAIENASEPVIAAAKQVASWNDQLNEWGRRTDELTSLLEKQNQQLNFVGLSHAFRALIHEKVSEKRWQIGLMIAFGVLLVAVPAYAAYVGSNGTLTWSLDLIPRMLPFAVVELVILYFFRIFLHNYYSAKAQLLQLKLRHGLCAFIQGYSEFAKGIGERTALDRFEAQIFSGISPDPENVPSHFDGVEQLVRMVKDLRSS